MYSIRYNRTTNHIAGIAAKCTSTGEEKGGVVAEYAENACGVLTRGRLAQGKSYESLDEALEAARITGGRKVCKSCEKAALAALEAAAAEPEAYDSLADQELSEDAELVAEFNAMLPTTTICYDCGKTVPVGSTELVTDPIIREGKTYHGMATSVQRRVCDACRTPKTTEWIFQLEYTFQGRTRTPQHRVYLPIGKTEHQAMIKVVQEWTREHVAEAELLSVELVSYRSY